MSRPADKTLVYAPEVKVLIATRRSGVIDLSPDLVSGEIRRVVDELSTFTLSFKNVLNRYNSVISRQDRIVIYMKRVKWVQVFSGYVSSVPYKSLFPSTATISGHCTLKRIRDTYWDPGLAENATLLAGFAAPSEASGTDGGVGKTLIQVLEKIGGWESEKIHIQALPDTYMDLVKQNLDSPDPDELERKILQLLGGTGALAGEEPTGESNTGTTTTPSPPTGYSSPAIDRMLSVASSQVGYREGAGNNNKYGVWYGWNRVPWCNIFVYWCAQKAKISKSVIPRTASVKTTYLWFNARGRIYRTPKRGDLFLQRTSSGFWKHIGIVKSVSGKTFRSVEGNASSNTGAKGGQGVVSNNHRVTSSYYFARPKYPVSKKSSSSATKTTVSGTKSKSLKALLQRVGFSGKALNIALGVVWAESKANAHALGDTTITNATWGPSVGLFQIRSLKHPPKSGVDAVRVRSKLMDAVYNAQAAYKISNKGKNWGPWSTYHSGSYKAHYGKDATIKNWGGGSSSTKPPSTTTTVKKKEKWIKPVNARVGSHFKQRGSWAKYHTGVDYLAGAGTSIKSVASGKVVYIKHGDGAWGNRTVIKHSNGLYSVYCHQSKISVSKNQSVKQGQVIGKVGSTGRAFGAHLHFEVWKKYKPGGYADGHEVNPLNYVGKTFTTIVTTKNPSGPSSDNVDDAVVENPGITEDQVKDIVAQTVFNTLYKDPVADYMSEALTGKRALLNDVSLLSTVREYVGAGMRRFQSAPNGDFLAFYPDYFGQNGTAPVLKLEDIEMIDVKIQLSDSPLTTHVFSITDMSMDRRIDEYDILSTTGVVSLEDDYPLRTLVSGGPEGLESGSEILSLFGARPLRTDYSNIHNQVFGFFLAMQTFQRKWAEQFSTYVSFTFMPELFPGMRVLLANHDLIVYVESVTHTFSFTEGFKTNAQISSPATLSDTNEGMVNSE